MKTIRVPLTYVLFFSVLLFSTLLPAAAEGLPLLGAAVAAADESAEGRDESYRQGRRALDAESWDEAVSHFDDVITRGGADADAALYWKAYAHHKADRRGAALAALAELEAKHGSSRWRDDARALRMEIREDSGTMDSAMDDDEELKLLALNSLMTMNPERALEMIERFLGNDRSEELQKRALFVLSQNPTDRAREILVEIARGSRGPDLQMAAIRYLGMTAGRASDELESIYRSSADTEVKEAVLHAYMLSQDTEKVMQVYRSEDDPKLRLAAVHQLGVMHANDELRNLYESENDSEVRGQILHSMFVGGDAEGLMEIYDTETDPKLKKKAIHSLGLTHDQGRGFLVELYGRETDQDVKADIIHALSLSQGVSELIGIIRNEKDQDLKKTAIKRLGLTHPEESRGFLVELYRTESSQDAKGDILHALFLNQASSELAEIARSETDQGLRKKAIRGLGMTHQEEGREILVELYREDSQQDIRKSVLHALFLSQAASELIEIARAETDQELRKDAIRKIGMIHSDEAVEFMMEILEER